MVSRNTEGLKKCAERKNAETLQKVNRAIDKLKRSKTAIINFNTVANEAGVSKATLYNNGVLRERIISLRGLPKGVTDQLQSAPPVSEDKVRRLYDEIKKLRGDKDNLIMQLIGLAELQDENRRLKEQVLRLKGVIPNDGG
jgi:hypothetical protein